LYVKREFSGFGITANSRFSFLEMIGQTVKKTPYFMSTLFVDYREEVKRLISELYEPANDITKEFEYTTEDLTENLKNILPYNAVDDHMVYECLRELNYSPSDVAGQPLNFIWYFKRKHNF
jgi:hypothetical protein